MDTYLTTTQVAELLGVARGTVTTMAYGQQFPGTRFYRDSGGPDDHPHPPRAVDAFIARSLDPDAAWDESDDQP